MSCRKSMAWRRTLSQLDVRDQPAVESAIASLPSEWEAIEVLVNNRV